MSSHSISKGEKWKGELLYDPNAGQESGKCYDDIYVKNFWEQIGRLEQMSLIDLSPCITEFAWYSCNIENTSLVSHWFIVFRTSDSWWWSVEKHNEGFHLQ